MKMTGLALLNTRRFFPLFVTQFLGAFNDNTFKNALVILITYRLTNLLDMNTQILVTLAAGIFILPFFLFSATAGQLADKCEKSRLISIIKLIEIILMIMAAVGFYLNHVFLLLFVLFCLGTHAAFFGPLKYAILPEQLQEKELIAGNGLIEAGTFLAILFGTILGGVLILHQYGSNIISIVILVVAVGGWIASLFIPKTTVRDRETFHLDLNIFKDTVALLKYSMRRTDIFLCILGISWFWVVGATFLSEFPLFSKDVLHANENIVTLFLALFSIGLAIGSLLCNKLLNGKVHATYVPLGALGMTLFMIDLYYASATNHVISTTELMTLPQFLSSFSGIRISFDLLCMALCCGIYTVPLYAILQQRSEAGHCSRVIASNNVFNALAMVLAAIATMMMLKLGFTVTQVFLTIAVFNALVAIYICKLLPDIIIRGFFRWVLILFYRVKVKGLEHYQAAGDRVVIIANHTSLLDALLLATFLPDKLTFAVNKTTAKKWWIRLFLRLVDAYPMDPTNPMAIKSLIELVKQNKRCVIFPEGRLTMTGALMKIYEGPGMVADKSNAKLLPIRIQGAQLTPFSRLKGKAPISYFPSITITIFPPEPITIPKEIKGRVRREQIGYTLYDVMTTVMFESSDYRKTLFSSLIDASATHGSNHVIVEDIERQPMTYRQLMIRSFTLGSVIAKSTHAGEHVGVLLPNMASNIVTFFALQAISRVPAMLNYSTGIQNVVIACQSARIKTVYTSHQFIHLAKLSEMINALIAAGIQVVYLEDIRVRLTTLDKLKGVIKGIWPRLAYRAAPEPDAPAVILFTSGSESTPKGVVLSHANIQANRYQLSSCVDFTASDKVFNALPIFHSFGLTGGALLPLLSGIKVFFYPSPLHYRIIPELAYDTNATIFFGTDTFLTHYGKHAHPYDFYSVRYVFSGAEKLREETRLLWSQKFGVRIFEGYGATECAPVIATNTPMQNKVGTVGRILPGIKYQLHPVPGIEQGGALSVNGPNIMSGYLLANNPGTVIAPEQGWYPTGDIVSIDDAGFVTILGRVKRFAKIAGEMVSLTMIEQQINQLWPQHQHAVISLPDPKKGEQLVIATTNPLATREEFARFAKDNNMADIAIPKKIVILQKMLLLGTGKIDYPGIKELVIQSFSFPPRNVGEGKDGG